MKKITSIISETIIIIFITLLFFLALELFSRILINLISKNKDIYFYGFNKKINIQIFDLSDLKINILNTEFQINKTKKIEKKNNLNQTIWVFGGSTSDVACRNTNNTSWSIELSNYPGTNVINFAKSGRNTDFSIKILQSELQKNGMRPDIILWANYVNEQDVLFTGLELNKDKIKIDQKVNFHKNNFILLLNRLDLSFYKNFVSYYFFKEVIKRIVNFDNQKKPIQILDDYNIAIENYNLNTFKAIQLSQKINSKFYIITLFTKNDFLNLKSDFGENYFFPNIKKILEKFPELKWIDTREEIDKINNFDKLFCDRIHFTKEGNKEIAKIILEKINN